MYTSTKKLQILAVVLIAVLLIFACAFIWVSPTAKLTAHADTTVSWENHEHGTDDTALFACPTNGILENGKYYLTADIMGTFIISGEVTLCLNGHTVDGQKNGSVFTVSEGAKFTLCNCKGTGRITNGSAYEGGGVYVNPNAEFLMTGGEISDNTAEQYGGGVRNFGTFEMSGGTISGNVVKQSYGGGGIYNTDRFEVWGKPVITGNKEGTTNLRNSNVCFSATQIIYVTGALTEGAQIYVNHIYHVAEGFPKNGQPSKYFFADDSSYDCVYIDKSNNKVKIYTHDFATGEEWTYDGDNHWHACKNGCGAKTDEAVHDYEDEKCTVCQKPQYLYWGTEEGTDDDGNATKTLVLGSVHNGVTLTRYTVGSENWSKLSGEITRVRVDNYAFAPFSTESWFSGFDKLKEADLSNLDTSGVTNMKSMFAMCTSLTTLNVSGFNTSNVMTMNSMFDECRALTELDVSSFDTSNVTDMSGMFRNCYKVTALDVSGFVTSNVTDMSLAFAKCEASETLDVSKFDTSNVTDMAWTFNCCKKLTTIDVSKFNTSNVTDMSNMFKSCNAVESLDVSNFNTSQVEWMSGMFSGCNAIKTIDLSKFDTSKVKDTDATLSSCNNLEVIKAPYKMGTNVELNLPKSGKWWNGETDVTMNKITQADAGKTFKYHPDCSGGKATCQEKAVCEICGTPYGNLKSHEAKEEWLHNEDKHWHECIYGCGTKLSEDEHNLNKGKCTDCDYAPLYWKLENGTLTLSSAKGEGDWINYDDRTWSSNSFDIVKAEVSGDVYAPESMRGWFRNFVNLGEVNLDGLNTEKVTDMSYLFAGCKKLSEINLSVLNTSNVENVSYMFNNCQNLVEVKLSGLNTSNVTDMRYMFADCKSLETLDISSFYIENADTLNVFYGCEKLEKIKAPYAMGANVKLTLPQSRWWNGETLVTNGKITQSDAGTTFEYHPFCSGEGGTCQQEAVCVICGQECGGKMPHSCNWYDEWFYDEDGHWHLCNYGCGTKINESKHNLNKGKCTVCGYAPLYWKLEDGTLTLSSAKGEGDWINYEEATWSSNFFDIEKVVVSGDVYAPESMAGWFLNCGNLYEVKLDGLNTEDVTNMNAMFRYCDNLYEVDLSVLNTSNVENMCYMFAHCTGLSKVDLSGLDTSNVTEMCSMFAYCTGLSKVDLSGLDTSNVTNMGEMFARCTGLIEVDLSGLDTSNVMGMENMFSSCKNLSTVNLSGLDTSNVNHMDSMFEDCSSLNTLDLSSFNIENVTTMSGIFYGCDSLKVIKAPKKMGNSELELPNSEAWWNGETDVYFSFGEDNAGKTLQYHPQCSGEEATCREYAVCAICGNPYGDLAQHESNGERGFDENGHWVGMCVYGCGEKIGEEEHDYYSGKCNVCDYAPIYWKLEEGTLYLGHENGEGDWINYAVNTWDSVKDAIIKVELSSEVYAPESMHGWFKDCVNLIESILVGLNTEEVTDMSYLFSGCKMLWNVYFGDVDTSNVTDISHMFKDCGNLQEINLTNLNFGNVTNISNMFSGCSKLFEINFDGCNLSNVVDMSHAFEGCRSLTEFYFGEFNTERVTDMSYAFRNCDSISYVDLSLLNTASVTDMSYMFDDCDMLETFYFNGITDSLEDMSYIFRNCPLLNSTDLTALNTESVTDMSHAFEGCTRLSEIYFNGLNLANVVDMSYTFNGCTSLNFVDFSGCNLSSVENMSHMFYRCNNLVNVDLSIFDTSNVTDMSHMFDGCDRLWELDLSSFDLTNVTDTTDMLESKSLYTIYAPQTPGNTEISLPDIFAYDGENGYTETTSISNNEAGTVLNRIHEFTVFSVIEEPTCISAGIQIAVCAHCDYSEERVLEKEPHPYGEWKITMEPTCSATGEIEGVCKYCDHVQTETLEANPHAHSWDEGKVTTEPQCTESGVTTYTCIHDSEHERTEEIAPIGHDPIPHSAKTATCTAIGWSEYLTCSRCDYTTYSEKPALNHDFTGEYERDGEGHWHVCQRENCTATDLKEEHEGGTATCKEKAECTVCGEEYGDFAEHMLSTLGVLPVPTTCTTSGTKPHWDCTVCGKPVDRNGNVIADLTIPASGHDFGEFVIDEESTCTSNGTKSKHCKNCDERIDIIEIEKIPHTYGVWEVTLAPTCSAVGQIKNTCTVCKHEETNVLEIDPNAHSWNDGEVTLSATCTQKGEKTFTCTHNSEHVKTEEISALGHAVILHEGKETTCTAIGWGEYETCTRCAYTTYEEISAFGHETVVHEGKDATCTEKGWNEYETCTRCDHTTYEELPALGHEPIVHEGKDATCTEKGWNEYETCSRCDHTTYEELHALGHAVVLHEGRDATCTAIGWNAYETCTRCAHTTYEEIPALGHEAVIHEGKVATCTEKGWMGYETCARCDYTDYAEIPALGHTEVTDSAVNPTCTESGKTEGKHCSVCNTVLASQTTIPALGHDYGEWTETKPATTKKEGEERRICSRDTEHFENRSIPKRKATLSGGGIAGIVIGIIIFTLLVSYVVGYFVFYRKGEVSDSIFAPMNAIFRKK